MDSTAQNMLEEHPRFSMENADDRQGLVERLLALGIPAQSDISLGTETPVSILLHAQTYQPVSQQPYELIVLTAFAKDLPCMIGLWGEHQFGQGREDCNSTDFYGEYSVERAASRVQLLWDARERIVAAFRAGYFDGGGSLLDLMDGKGKRKRGKKR